MILDVHVSSRQVAKLYRERDHFDACRIGIPQR